ncbi:MAG: hypothetical protein J4428_00970 [Candidatus Aenigmarchaeota archaeon]|nr:hypothetical protein [Candidatus Aenigmarchaeota archaeon]
MKNSVIELICDDIKNLHKYAVDNNLEISSYDLVKIVCKNCLIKENCP